MTRNIVYIVAFVCLITGFILWYRGNTPPRLTIPTPAPPPGPNAFDDFNRATTMLQHDSDIGSVYKSLKPDDPKFDPASAPAGLTTQQEDAYARDNAPAFAVLRQGFTHAYFAPPVRSPAQLLPYLAKYRQMARALSFDGRVAARRGDWNRTMSDSLDAVQLGTTTPQHMGLIHELVGIACSAIGRVDAWPSVDHLSAPQAEGAARRLERIQAQRFPFSGTLEEEKWSGEATLDWIFHTRSGLGDIFSLSSGSSGSTSITGPIPSMLQENILWTIYPKSTVARSYIGYMDRQIQIASLPYPVARRTPPPPIPRDPINSIMLPMFDKGRFKNLADDTYNQLLIASLALRAYKLDHGQYPASLNELVPNYLSSVPTDPFANALLKYSLVAPGKYLLYSIGPDGIDNHGAPIAHDPVAVSATQKTSPRLLQDSDTGDVVAGASRG